MSKKLTTEEFIKIAKVIHGDKFDYSKVIFINNYSKVIIICKIHGIFYQTPNNHLKGKGCKRCASDKMSSIRRSSIQEFIEKARKIHGDKYDYSKFIYINSWTKGIIICPIHGEFEQTPNSHLTGSGCHKCKTEKHILNNISNIQEFIEKARKIHGDLYDYSLSIYINSWSNIIIICPIHGIFEQTPDNHLAGKGCKKCGFNKRANSNRSNTYEFIKKATINHNGYYDYSLAKFINDISKIKIICPIHGIFEQVPSNHLQGAGCPKCNRSKGEIAISDILEKHNISFQEQYKIPEVVHNFEYDFYLPTYNLLIEFHGRQHYEPIEFFGGEDNLAYIRKNDEIKKHNAYKFKYRFIEFNYKHLKFLTKEQFEELVILNIGRDKASFKSLPKSEGGGSSNLLEEMLN